MRAEGENLGSNEMTASSGVWRVLEDRLRLSAGTTPTEVIRLRSLVILSLLTATILVFFSVFRGVMEGFGEPNTLLGILAACIFLITPAIIWTFRTLDLPAIVLVSFSVFAINLAGYLREGLGVPSLAYLTLLTTFASIMWGAKGGFAGLVFSIGTIVFLGMQSGYGLMLTSDDPSELRIKLLAAIILLVATQLSIIVGSFRQTFFDVAGQVLRARQNLQIVLDHMDQGICVYDGDLNLVAWSPLFGQMLNLREEDLERNATLKGVLRLNALNGAYGEGPVDEIVEGRYSRLLDAEGRLKITQHRYERPSQDGRLLEVFGKPLPGGGMLSTYTDVTEKAEQRSKIEELALTDALTGLANRHQFQAHLKESIKLARRRNKRIALCLLDLDKFKPINDMHGHPVGDFVLITVAKRIRESVREVDTVSRFGGDEFGIIITDLDDQDSVLIPCKRVLSSICDPIAHECGTLEVGTSIGVSYFPDDGEDPDDLIRKADLALYEAKAAGRRTIRVFDREIDMRVQRVAQLEIELRDAIRNDELELYFQPQINLRDHTIRCLEALVRWNHPTRGLLTPDKFLDVADSGDLTRDLGAWVLKKGLEHARKWQARGIEFGSLALNVSPRQFRRSEFFHLVKEAIDSGGVDPKLIELEITEDALSDEVDGLPSLLKQINELGPSISIDDFGTGHSSLARLRDFPLQHLKIDRSFVNNLPGDHRAANITEAIIRMAHSLGLGVIAEGVERPEQEAFLSEIGCDGAQGYIFARPLPEGDLHQWLDTWQSKHRQVAV